MTKDRAAERSVYKQRYGGYQRPKEAKLPPAEREWIHDLPPITEVDLACGNCGGTEKELHKNQANGGKYFRCGCCKSKWCPCPSEDQISQRCAELNAQRPKQRKPASPPGIRVCKLIVKKKKKEIY